MDESGWNIYDVFGDYRVRQEPDAARAVPEIDDQSAALVLISVAVATTIGVWLLMQITKNVIGVLKNIMFIWICVASYNYLATAVSTSLNMYYLVMYFTNVTERFSGGFR